MIDEDNIYSTVPEEAICEVPSEAKDMILEFLKDNLGKFFTARTIAFKVGLNPNGTQVEVRKAITLLLTLDKEPIVGNVKGFCYTTDKDMIQFYINKLSKRMLGIQRRKDALRDILNTIEGESLVISNLLFLLLNVCIVVDGQLRKLGNN